MKYLKIRFVAFFGLIVMCAALLAPIVAEAGCPAIQVQCSNGDLKSCTGTQEGHRCYYDQACLNC